MVRRCAFGHSVQARLDLQRLGGGEEGIEQYLLRHDTDRNLRIARMLVDVEAPDGGGAAGLVHEPREDVDHRRLAGPVGPEQPENLPARHVDADPVQCALAAGISLLEIVDGDGGVDHGASA
jgi:hypothetical protein